MGWPKFIVDWVEENSKLWAPVPRIVAAYIAGPVRWEKLGAENGTDVYLSGMANRKLENIGAAEAGLSADYGITHLQKQSKWGWLITEPFCFYVWWQIQPQQEKIGDGGVTVTIPGSEICPTFRIGKGRWDPVQKLYIKPTLQAGLHWD
jgi:hypothetical protein